MRTKILSAFFFLSFITLTLQAETKKIVFIHTNDTHSQIEPTSKSASKDPDMGGILRRKALIDSVRNVEKNVFLVDAGDCVQGTPYFNFFKGKPEIELMNALGYEIGTIGNHEFDNGVEALAQMYSLAKFDIINANYDVSKTALASKIKPYVIKEIDGITVGFIGLGVNPESLIEAKNFKGIIFHDPIETANKVAAQLKEKGVNVIVILSHIGFEEPGNVPDDIKLAEQSENIDVIIGGHTHTLLPVAKKVKNKLGKDFIIGQTGKSGLNVGIIELTVEKE